MHNAKCKIEELLKYSHNGDEIANSRKPQVFISLSVIENLPMKSAIHSIKGN